MAEAITIDELLAAFKEAGFTGEEDSPGKTAPELAAIWNCSVGKVKAHMFRAREAGMLRVGRRLITRIDGGLARVPVYSFVFEAPKKRKATRRGRGK